MIRESLRNRSYLLLQTDFALQQFRRVLGWNLLDVAVIVGKKSFEPFMSCHLAIEFANMNIWIDEMP